MDRDAWLLQRPGVIARKATEVRTHYALGAITFGFVIAMYAMMVLFFHFTVTDLQDIKNAIATPTMEAPR